MIGQWGPNLWHIIHSIAILYPDRPSQKDRYYARQLVNTIAFILPCFKCQKHYITNITKLKPNLDSSNSFFKWTVKIHNIVNKNTKKKIYSIPMAYDVNNSILNSKKIEKLFTYLKIESRNYNISQQALIRFIDIVMYFNNNYSKKNNN